MRGPRRTGRLSGHLTERQRTVLALRVQGWSWPKIAKRLRLSRATVRQHYAYALAKSRVRLARRAKRGAGVAGVEGEA